MIRIYDFISLTIATRVHINVVANSDVDHAQKALISLLEFFLIEDLDGQDAVLGDFAVIGLGYGNLVCKGQERGASVV